MDLTVGPAGTWAFLVEAQGHNLACDHGLERRTSCEWDMGLLSRPSKQKDAILLEIMDLNVGPAVNGT